MLISNRKLSVSVSYAAMAFVSNALAAFSPFQIAFLEVIRDTDKRASRGKTLQGAPHLTPSDE